MNKLLFIGLGNPGTKYEYTRHNLGITMLRQWVADNASLAQAHQPWKVANLVQQAQLVLPATGGQSVTVDCIFPLTFMNRSGEAVHAFIKNTHHTPEQLIIIHDEVELPLGSVKEVAGGSAKGHKGVRSIHQALGTRDVARLRLGVGRPTGEHPLDQYVLEGFTEAELPAVQTMLDQAGKMLTVIIQSAITNGISQNS